MSNLKFEVEWGQAEDSDPRRANTAAEFILLINEVPATRLLDMWSKTVTDRARLPLYPLAEWFAVNWWRLHAEAPFEAGGRPPADWRLTHDLGAVGGGFVWPRVRFASDGVAIQASARALRNAPWEPVRHLNDIPVTPIATEVFDQAVDEFVAIVIQRLEDLRVCAEPLVTIWADVLAERSDPEVAEWRRWEARLGYAADEAPEDVMWEVKAFSERVGADAMAELAPLLRPQEATNLKRFNDLALAPGIEAHLPLAPAGLVVPEGTPPWEIGRGLSYHIRNQAGLGTGPLDDDVLTKLLGVGREAFDELMVSGANVGLGVRLAQQNKTVLHFRKRNPHGRRFEAARFLADHLVSSVQDIWLPLTDRATARQKIQRAFAAELLAPIEELKEFVGDDRLSERIEDAGEYFGISPLAIRSHLANHGLLSTEEVAV
jgi:hypothetical protein